MLMVGEISNINNSVDSLHIKDEVYVFSAFYCSVMRWFYGNLRIMCSVVWKYTEILNVKQRSEVKIFTHSHVLKSCELSNLDIMMCLNEGQCYRNICVGRRVELVVCNCLLQCSGGGLSKRRDAPK
jgi:hypothetical protein